MYVVDTRIHFSNNGQFILVQGYIISVLQFYLYISYFVVECVLKWVTRKVSCTRAIL